MQTARQYPGQEQQVYEYYTKNPDAMANFRAPLFEEKVVDHLMSEISITDKTVSKDELLKEDEEEPAKDNKKKKTSGKKAAPKKAAKDTSGGSDSPSAKKSTAATKKTTKKQDADSDE